MLDELLMTTRSSGSDGGYSVVSSLLSGTSVAGAICGGGGRERVSSLSCFARRDQILLSSIQRISSASIGIGVNMTGAVGNGFDFFRIGDSGGGIVESFVSVPVGS